MSEPVRYRHPFQRPSYQPGRWETDEEGGILFDGNKLVQVALIANSSEKTLNIHLSFGKCHDGLEYILHGTAVRLDDSYVFVYKPKTAVSLSGRVVRVRVENEQGAAFCIANDDFGYDHVEQHYPIDVPPDSKTVSVTSDQGCLQTITLYLQ